MTVTWKAVAIAALVLLALVLIAGCAAPGCDDDAAQGVVLADDCEGDDD